MPVNAPPAESVKNKQKKEAEEQYKTGRGLCEQGKQEEGILLLFKAFRT